MLQEINSSEIKFASTNEEVYIHVFSQLDEKMKRVALENIADINKKTSTQPGVNWSNYTRMIKDRLKSCKNAQHTFYVAQVAEKIVGYAVFYTQIDRLANCKYLDNNNEAYCSWVAVDESFRGRGIAEKLQLQIFNSENNIHSFKEHVKKTNEASLKVLNKFRENGYDVSEVESGHQLLCTVKKQVNLL